MAQFTYTKVEATVPKEDFDTWLTAQTTTADTRIIFYQELQATDNESTRIKLIIEVQS